MSRPIRIEIEDGWYHVISRGIERRDIFCDDSDRGDFLERLFGLTESHALLVHAYCLIQNHFHLQLQTPQPNLKEAMQRLLSGYAVRFNLRHRRAGPLFQGHYRAVLAGEEDCITEVNRYIHLNPARLESLDLGKRVLRRNEWVEIGSERGCLMVWCASRSTQASSFRKTPRYRYGPCKRKMLPTASRSRGRCDYRVSER